MRIGDPAEWEIVQNEFEGKVLGVYIKVLQRNKTIGYVYIDVGGDRIDIDDDIDDIDRMGFIMRDWLMWSWRQRYPMVYIMQAGKLGKMIV